MRIDGLITRENMNQKFLKFFLDTIHWSNPHVSVEFFSMFRLYTWDKIIMVTIPILISVCTFKRPEETEQWSTDWGIHTTKFYWLCYEGLWSRWSHLVRCGCIGSQYNNDVSLECLDMFHRNKAKVLYRFVSMDRKGVHVLTSEVK